MRFGSARRPSRISSRSASRLVAASTGFASWVKPLLIGPPCADRGRRSALSVFRQAKAEKLPAVARIEEAAIGRTDVLGPCRARAAANDHLVAHELAVVLAERAGERLEAGIGGVRRRGPFPHVAVELAEARCAVFGVRGFWAGRGIQQPRVEEISRDGLLRGGELPFGLRRPARAGPACERVRLVVADVTDRRVGIDRPPSAEGELLLEVLRPVERTAPAFLADLRPAVGEPERGVVVSALLDEFAVLGVRDEAVGERVIAN